MGFKVVDLTKPYYGTYELANMMCFMIHVMMTHKTDIFSCVFHGLVKSINQSFLFECISKDLKHRETLSGTYAKPARKCTQKKNMTTGYNWGPEVNALGLTD